ncbi:hypothetical protein GCM10027184_71240 [Saccharothrix stipae]
MLCFRTHDVVVVPVKPGQTCSYLRVDRRPCDTPSVLTWRNPNAGRGAHIHPDVGYANESGARMRWRFPARDAGRGGPATALEGLAGMCGR